MNEGVGKCNKLRLQEALPEVDYAARPDAGSEASNDSSEGVPASGRSEGANYQVSTTQWYAVTLYERIDWQLVSLGAGAVNEGRNHCAAAFQSFGKARKDEKKGGLVARKKMVGCKDKENATERKKGNKKKKGIKLE